MAVMDQFLGKNHAIYCGDFMDVARKLRSQSIHHVLYSPAFMGLYVYSSDPRDLSNCVNKEEFFTQYGFWIDEIARLILPGRICSVHCMDIPLSNSGCDAMFDLPGRIIAEHESRGFAYAGRRVIWKEPLAVRNRTMMKSLHHATLCDDSTRTSIANADYLLCFRRRGENKIPVAHPRGLLSYAGESSPPADTFRTRGMTGDQKKNIYSQWIWRQYASCIWDDIRLNRVLPYREAKDDQDEKHNHPLQLDVIERSVVMYSNPGETVLSPCAGVGSELFGALVNGRRAIGAELHPGYYRQAVLNLEQAEKEVPAPLPDLFAGLEEEASPEPDLPELLAPDKWDREPERNPEEGAA